MRYATPERSAEQLELLTRHAETRARSGSSFRIACKLLAAGDTGFARRRRTISRRGRPASARGSRCRRAATSRDFQARRANIRYRPAPGREAALRAHAERLGARVSAHDRLHPRALSAARTARVTVPDALRPYLGVDALALSAMRRGAPRLLVATAARAAARRRTSWYTQRVVRRAARARRERSSADVRARVPRVRPIRAPDAAHDALLDLRAA